MWFPIERGAPSPKLSPAAEAFGEGLSVERMTQTLRARMTADLFYFVARGSWLVVQAKKSA